MGDSRGENQGTGSHSPSATHPVEKRHLISFIIIFFIQVPRMIVLDAPVKLTCEPTFFFFGNNVSIDGSDVDAG